MKKSKKRIAAILLTIILILSSFSGNNVQVIKAAETKTLAGILICGNCKGSSSGTKHTTACCLMDSCKSSGYGIVVPQADKTYKFYALDDTGDSKAYTLLNELKSNGVQNYLSVNVTGVVDETPGEYTYTYTNKAGTATTAAVTYDGTISKLAIEYDDAHETYTQNAIDLSTAGIKIADIPDQIYTGDSVTPTAITVTDGDYTLSSKSPDYTVTYENNTNVGQATVVINGTGAFYKGSIKKTFNIVSDKNVTPTVSPVTSPILSPTVTKTTPAPTQNLKFSVNKKAVTILKGKTVTLTVSNNSGSVTWKSSNEKVAKVDNGKVTAIKVGTAYISATSGGKTLKSKITVVNPKINKGKVTLKVSHSYTLKVTGGKGTVKWWADNQNIVSVSLGKVTAKKKGRTYVYARVNGKKLKTKVTVKE